MQTFRRDQVTIRTATLADAGDIAGMHVASWHETCSGMLPAEMLASLSVDGRTAIWTRIMGEPATSGSTVVYVAELENRIAGFGAASLWVLRDNAPARRFYERYGDQRGQRQ